MGTRTKYLSLIAATAIAFSAAPSSSSRNASVTRERSPAKVAGKGQPDGPEAGTVSGAVRVVGAQTTAARISMAADPACLKIHPAPTMSEEVVTGANGALKNAIVYISNGVGNRSFDPPKEPAVFEQKGCTYNPRVLGMQASQNLQIVNLDPTSHNIHPVPQNNREWNIFQPPGSSPIAETFTREEIIPVRCNVHPWMKGYIAVFKHPYFAITKEDGAFDLKHVPPGEYTIQAWHERYGVLTQKVTLETNQTKVLEFAFRPSGAK